jgi:hypothetical protein
MVNRFTFRATKSLGLTITVYASDQDDAEEQAYEIASNTSYDEWAGAEDDDELELIDEEPCEADGEEGDDERTHMFKRGQHSRIPKGTIGLQSDGSWVGTHWEFDSDTVRQIRASQNDAQATEILQRLINTVLSNVAAAEAAHHQHRRRFVERMGVPFRHPPHDPENPETSKRLIGELQEEFWNSFDEIRATR